MFSTNLNNPIIANNPRIGVFDVASVDEPLPTEEATVLQLGLTGYQRVKRFMTVMEQSTPETPQWPSEEDFRLRVRLDLEEFFEKLIKGYFLGDPVEILDGACDVEVVGIGSIISFGVDYDLAIAEVDRSNMSKLGEDGKPIKDAGGKVQKGPNFSKPDIKQFLRGLENVPAPYDTRAITHEEYMKMYSLDEKHAHIREFYNYVADETF